MIKKTQKHLKQANESYFEHMGIALKISFQLLIGSIMAFVHAILPSLFTTSASNKIKKIYSFVESRNNNYK
tara:strand:- start:659 stop:871 length:213 start_codon:yes stop_codon:yes gene_type:complete